MDARTRYLAESLRATFALARLLGLTANEIVVMAEGELCRCRDEMVRAADPEPDGA